MSALTAKGVLYLRDGKRSFGVSNPRQDLFRKLLVAFLLAFNFSRYSFVGLVQSFYSLKQVLQSSFNMPKCGLAHEGIHM